MKINKDSSQSTAQGPAVGQLPFRIPPLLLEGDEAGAPAPAAGPGEKFALGPAAPAGRLDSPAARLPEAYGTRTLLLTARHPHWLYAHWDVAPAEQLQYCAPAAARHLVLRVHERALSGPLAAEIHLHPDSRHWSVYVPRAETQYVAELGFSLPGGLWQRVATSQAAATPPDSVSQDTTMRFATFEPMAPASAATAPRPARQAPATQPPGVPQAPSALPSPKLSPSTRRIKPETSTGKSAPGPEQAVRLLQISELLRREAEPDIGWRAARQLGLPGLAGGGPAITSPGMAVAAAGAGQQPKGFWLNINAEVVVYGATEPDAQMAIGGQPLPLRPDGTFSYRFALPDGNYELVATAISAHKELRQVRLRLSRRTD